MAHAVVAVDERGCRRALDNADIRLRVDVTTFDGAHIAGQSEDAVGIRSGEIGIEHRSGGDRRIGHRQPAGAKCIGHEGLDG